MKLAFLLLTVIVFCDASVFAQWIIPTNAATELPPGIPRAVDTNGNVVDIDFDFTTQAYREEALRLVLTEANQVARDLNLTNELPITESNLTEYYIGPFRYNYIRQCVGNITTKDYIYYVNCGNKFADLAVADYDRVCLEFRKKVIPVRLMNTNAAYQFATQSLIAVKMDVAALNRDCKVHIAVSPYWNGLSHLGDQPHKQFSPIYYVWWTSPQNETEKYGSTAYIEFFLPTKKLLSLRVEDQKYILRKPLVFTNLAALFPGVAPIHTNYPTEPILIDEGKLK